MAVIGSSLGGFYATCVAEATGCRAVLLNPAVHPARDLARYIGEQTAWHDPAEHFFFAPRVRGRTAGAGKHGALAAPGELLRGHRQGRRGAGLARDDRPLPGSRIKLLEGGDHALSDFDSHIGGSAAISSSWPERQHDRAWDNRAHVCIV